MKTNIIGSTLKSLLATKTVIFIGFSFGDEDFKQILDYVVKEMKDYMPHIFVVTTDDTLQERVKYQNLTAIITDGTFFIHKLKSDLISEGYLLNPDIGQDIYYMYSLVQTKHEDLVKHIDYINCPQIIYCLSYQDGILHAFERFIQLESTGKYYEPSHISKVIKSYDYLLEQYQKSNLYWDVAYIEGYINALVYMLADDDAKKNFRNFICRMLQEN